jgi:hypothetical protein
LQVIARLRRSRNGQLAVGVKGAVAAGYATRSPARQTPKRGTGIAFSCFRF